MRKLAQGYKKKININYEKTWCKVEQTVQYETKKCKAKKHPIIQ